MKVALGFVTLLLVLSCPLAAAEIIVTSGDIGPSDPAVMIHNNVGCLMTRPESWVISTIVIPYPSELVGETELSITVYFVPDSPSAGDVSFKVHYYAYGVGDDWNFGGIGPIVDPPAVPVAGSDTRVYSQVFHYNNTVPVNELFRINISRYIYGDPPDTYPTGVYVHAVKIEGAGTNATGDPAKPSLQSGALQIVPNPSTHEAAFKYELNRVGDVSIHVYDVEGRVIERLEQGMQTAGRHSLEWEMPDANKGVYFVKLIVDGAVTTSKLLRVE